MNHPATDPAALAAQVSAILAALRQRPGPAAAGPARHPGHALGFIPPDAVATIAAAFNLSRAEVHGVVTFYHYFRTAPPARHVIQICRAEACQSMGGDALLAHAEQALGCGLHEHSAGRQFRAGAGVLPGPVRHLAGHHDRRRRARARDAGALRCADRQSQGGRMSVRIFVPRDSTALALGADDVAARHRRRSGAPPASTSRSSATAPAACSGSSRWSKSRRRPAASASARSTAPTSPALFDAGFHLGQGSHRAGARPGRADSLPGAARAA